MDIKKYALFVDVADTKSFTKSGERMGYTQPGVSHNLKTLEDELGFSLFQRTKQGIVLTSDAEAILPLVRQLLDANEALEQTIQSINGLQTGHITIASFASISRNWLPPVIQAFHQQYPGIEVELLEGTADDIVSLVTNSRADFGLMSRSHTETLKWIPLYEDPLMAILPRNFCPPSQTAYPIKELTDQPFIMSTNTDYDVYFALESSGVRPKILLSSKDELTVIRLVANNLGLSILSQLMISGMSGQIQALPLDPPYSRQLGIALRPKMSPVPAARRFISFLEERLPELLSRGPITAENGWDAAGKGL